MSCCPEPQIQQSQGEPSLDSQPTSDFDLNKTCFSNMSDMTCADLEDCIGYCWIRTFSAQANKECRKSMSEIYHSRCVGLVTPEKTDG